MNQEETRLMNLFCDYYDELVNSHLVEGCMGILDPQEITSLNAGIATVFTINKLLKEETK